MQPLILRLDGDFYESTRDGLVNLYDKLSIGGFAIIDDAGGTQVPIAERPLMNSAQSGASTSPLSVWTPSAASGGKRASYEAIARPRIIQLVNRRCS